MVIDPVLTMLWLAALRRRSLDTVLAQLETYPSIYRPRARAQRIVIGLRTPANSMID